MAYVYPKVGDRVKYLGTRMFWFTNIIKNAEDNLTVGTVYTISKVDIASSWIGITLVETGDLVYSYSWFKPVA
jgi:hypothetical protein